ncbi:MAG: alpha-amylase family glycosyl hydrolase [Schaedlerella sp.]|nr:alpha-amylase family glycosyl hydrolase [Schaedlerella sp.]
MRQAAGMPLPLGTEKKNDGINFAVAVPAGRSCELLLYRRRKEEAVKVFVLPEEDAIGEIRCLMLEGMKQDSYEYNYRIDGKIYTDPYAKAISTFKTTDKETGEKKIQIRGKFVNNEYDWEGDKLLKIPYDEVIAYSLHVKGFTKHISSRVRHKGTFAGIVEKLEYLKELGINQIQCMPVYEFEDIVNKKTNYWGYGSGYYFVPKAAYSASKDTSAELKDMVKACHKEGIEVILEMPFDSGILPQAALSCLQYYVMEYHVDGFIVNPYCVPWDMLVNDPMLKGVKIMRKNEWFQNTLRRFMKSDGGMLWEVMEALKRKPGTDGECNYITTHTGFTLYDLVSYNEKHNELNGESNTDGPDQNYSWNCGEEGPSQMRTVTTLRNNQIRNAFFMLLMAQGTPCILAGDEFKNTQFGNNNVYCQDNELSWLDWKDLKKEAELFEYVKKLIALRKIHFSLHKKAGLLGLDKTGSGIPDVSYHGEEAWKIQTEAGDRELGVLYNDVLDGKQDTCFIAYNMHWNKREFALPVVYGKSWYKILDTSDEKISDMKELTEARSIRLNGRSIVMLVAE